MNPDLPEVATDFGSSARSAFARLGGVDLARRAEANPTARRQVAVALTALGIDDLDPTADADAAAAAATLCEAAGRVALPYPLPGVLLRGADGLPFAVVAEPQLRVDHGDLFERWRAATVNGGTGVAEPAGPPLQSRLGPFVTALEAIGGPEPGGHACSRRAALWLVLGAWAVLGAADRAVELAVEHTTNRIQFGKPLTAFQAVRFQLADAAVAVAGLRELALFTLWRLHAPPTECWADVLALRVHALDVAGQVLRTSQQLHGAAGVCDDYDISILVRHLQPALRLPHGAEHTADQLAAAIDRDGFDGLFQHGRQAQLTGSTR